MPQPPLLALLDIDGTLLLDDAHAHERAMTEAMRRVYGVELPDDAVNGVAPWGKTDVRIAREVLLQRGVDAHTFASMLARWEACTGDLFQVYAADSVSRWRIRPGVRGALTALLADRLRLALLTGNLHAVAITKMTCTGLLELVDLTASAFGNDEEDRELLATLARTRAGGDRGPWPRDRTVVVGDTPGDVAAAHADEVRSVLFSSARHPRQALYGATIVIEDADALVAVLHGWR